MLSTCPQYCGHCTRMDLVGNDVPQVIKLKFQIPQKDRYQQMLDYLRVTPSVRDVVVSGGDIANVPIGALEDFVSKLMDIPNIRDIRNVHQRPDRDSTAFPAARSAGWAGAAGEKSAGAWRGYCRAHAREQRAPGDAAGKKSGGVAARYGLSRRPQPGSIVARGEYFPEGVAGALFCVARFRQDHAVLL